MIYNNYPDDYIVINAKWVEWDNDNECWCFMTEDAFEKAQSLADYTKQVRKDIIDILAINLMLNFSGDKMLSSDDFCEWLLKQREQIQGETK